ncbi:MAG: GNAT family N-acetyltransferase [Patescibacteria group bacterium]
MISSYIETDIKKCELLWKEFSPKQSLFDLWDFCLDLCMAYDHDPYFIVLEEDNKNVGILPLCYIKDKKCYFWFGGWWQEGISFWIKKIDYIPVLLSSCPYRTFFKSISINDEKAVEKIKGFVSTRPQPKTDFGIDDEKYVLDISETKSFNDYLSKMNKKRRKYIKKNLQLIEERKPEVIFNNFSDFERLVFFAKERFKKDEIDENSPWDNDCWKNPAQTKVFYDIMKHSGDHYQTRMITVKIDGEMAGADIIVIFNGCYYALAGGYNVKKFPGIGSYFNMLNISDALSFGLNKIDVLQGDCGWKHRWYEKVPLYYFSYES